MLPIPSSKDDEEDEEFLRSIIFPEEDRRQFTTAAWRGGFRWFRSPNVYPIEKYRGLKGRRSKGQQR